MENFNELQLPQALLQSLEKMGFTTPTPIQAQAIPFALQGRDIMGSAQTGTGKTAAFGIPLIAHLMNTPSGTALVMTPTRELATQVAQAIRQMIDRESGIKMAILIGGEPMGRQFEQLRQSPRIVVGTPGRINDHLSRGTVKLHDTNFLVLDETDRMLDMGFGVQIDKILRYMPKERQTLMFSATLPPHILKMSDRYMKNPQRVAAGSVSEPIEKIKQEIVRTPVALKYEALTKELDARTGSIIVFVKTKHGADRLAHKLDRENHSADAIHGDLRQNKRDKVIRNFREKKYRILVATDVAARGLDIPHIEHVINYDLPQCPEDYIHRIGRTARAGATGSAVCILTPEDGAKWNAITRLIDPSAKPEHTEGFQPQRNGGNRSRNNNNRSRPGQRSGGGGFKGRSDGPRYDKPRYDRGSDKKSEGGGGYEKPRFKKFDRDDRPQRAERSDRPARQDRAENSARPQRTERSEFRNDRPKRFERSDRPADARPGRPKFERSERPQRTEFRSDRNEGGYKKFGPKREGSEGNRDRAARPEGRNDRFHSAKESPAFIAGSGPRPERSGDEPKRRNKNKDRHVKRPKPFEFKKHDRSGKKRDDAGNFKPREQEERKTA